MADYKVTLPSADPIMVRASNRAQAIRFATHKLVAIETLTTEDAIALGAKGQQLLDATGMAEESEAPLLAAPDGGEAKEPDPAGKDAITPPAAPSGASARSPKAEKPIEEDA